MPFRFVSRTIVGLCRTVTAVIFCSVDDEIVAAEPFPATGVRANRAIKKMELLLWGSATRNGYSASVVGGACVGLTVENVWLRLSSPQSLSYYQISNSLRTTRQTGGPEEGFRSGGNQDGPSS